MSTATRHAHAAGTLRAGHSAPAWACHPAPGGEGMRISQAIKDQGGPMASPAAVLRGTIQQGWRESGQLPEGVRRPLPDAVRQEFERADEANEGEAHLLALHQRTGQDAPTCRALVTHDEPRGDYRYSRWTQATGEAFEFLGSVLAAVDDPHCDWLYLLFQNRALGDKTYPEFPPRVERVESAAAGLQAFCYRVFRSTNRDDSFHWVLLKLRRDLPGAE